MKLVRGPSEYRKPVNVGLMFFNDSPDDFFPYAQIEVVIKPDPTRIDMRERVFKGPLDKQLRDPVFVNERVEQLVQPERRKNSRRTTDEIRQLSLFYIPGSIMTISSIKGIWKDEITLVHVLIAQKNQMREWYNIAKPFLSEEENRLMDDINLITPESIHLNAFMYEPLIDISIWTLNDIFLRSVALNITV